MAKGWRVSVEVARDAHAPLMDAGVERLTEVLADEGIVISRENSGAVLVRMTVEATGEWAARSTAESKLRAAPNEVWAEFGLPPFAITFVEVAPEAHA